MDSQLSPFEEQLAAAMREFADHSEPLTIDPQRIVRGAHHRTRLAVAAAVAVLVAGGVGAALALVPPSHPQVTDVATQTTTPTGATTGPRTVTADPGLTAPPSASGVTSGGATASSATTTTGGGLPSPTTHTTASVPTCLSSQLTVTSEFNARDESGYREAWAVIFTNNSATACQLNGYPTVVANSTDGAPITTTDTPRGPLGGLPAGTTTPPHVVLAAHGGTASALIEGSGSSGDPAQQAPNCGVDQSVAAVTAPGTREKTDVEMTVGACNGWQVHPVVPGTSGNG